MHKLGRIIQAWRNKLPPPQNTLVHHHCLLYTGTSAILSENQHGIWRCAVCKNTSDTLNQTFSYHCFTCNDFDICRDCFEPKRHLSHIHELKVVNTSLVYAHKNGRWVCDICGNESRWYEKFAYHCSECEFDVCPDCFKPHPTPLHAHPLYKSKSQDVCSVFSDFWKCDNCGSPQSSVADNKPWHCPTCKYNLCHSCMRATNEAFGFNRLPDEHPWAPGLRLKPIEVW